MAAKIAECVVCEKPLRSAPTRKYWIRIRYGEGICYECVLQCARTVLAGMQHESEQKQTRIQKEKA